MLVFHKSLTPGRLMTDILTSSYAGVGQGCVCCAGGEDQFDSFLCRSLDKFTSDVFESKMNARKSRAGLVTVDDTAI